MSASIDLCSITTDARGPTFSSSCRWDALFNMDVKRTLDHAALAKYFVTTMTQVGKTPLEIPSHLIVSGTLTFLSLIRLPNTTENTKL